ncbi:transposase [Candidatus Bathyarchaeota archaeon]|nr:transposase [Candidatus Bathyarchaeota archaeon]MBS7612806.1 transposase [Candidatus Bathyarchaeota archaeon]
MEVVLGVPFTYSPTDDLRKLLEDFRDMVNFCIEFAFKRRISSYAKLRKGVYEDWKKKWDYSTHFCHSACKISLAMLKSYRRKRRKGKPEAKKLFMQLDLQLYKFYGDRIRISVKPRKFAYVELKYGEYQRKFIDAWKAGKLKTGEITINETKVIVPFKKDVDLSNPSDWIAIDINESNITTVSSNPHIIRLEPKIREIRSAYFEKRRKIQKLAKHKPLTSQRLMAKYSKREKNKVKDMCHKLAKSIVDFAKQHNFGIILEDLKNMRRRIKYSRRMNRRLHSLPFRKLQSYIEYKAHSASLPVIHVDAKYTSSLCPICGGRLASNGHRLLKCECGFEGDRDIIACLNMLKRNPRCGEPPLPPKATYEALAEVEDLVAKVNARSERSPNSLLQSLKFSRSAATTVEEVYTVIRIHK